MNDHSSTHNENPAFWRVVVWVAATLGSALLGALVKDYWEAARPVVELQSISITASGQAGQPQLPPKLLNSIRRHPYYQLDEEQELSAGELQKVLQRNERTDLDAQAIVDTIPRLIDYLKKTSPDLDVSIRRRDFVRIWDAGDVGNMMERWAKGVLASYESELPPTYQRHPEGAERTFIPTKTGTFDLSEIDEEAQAQQESEARGPVGVYNRVLLDAHRTNLLRRLWLYQDPAILIPFLEELATDVTRVIEESNQIAVELKTFTIPSGPSHLSATVMITNTGRRPLPISSEGVLFLHLPAQSAKKPDNIIPANIQIVGESGASLIRGNEARILKYVTIGNLEAVFESVSADVESFKQLYNGGGVRARVALARAGADEKNLVVGPSHIRPIGPRSTNDSYDYIRNQDKLYIKSAK